MLQLAHRAKPGRRTARPSHPTTLRNWYYPERMPVSRRAFLGAVPAALAAQSAAPAAINRRDVVSRHPPQPVALSLTAYLASSTLDQSFASLQSRMTGATSLGHGPT